MYIWLNSFITVLLAIAVSQSFLLDLVYQTESQMKGIFVWWCFFCCVMIWSVVKMSPGRLMIVVLCEFSCFIQGVLTFTLTGLLLFSDHYRCVSCCLSVCISKDCYTRMTNNFECWSYPQQAFSYCYISYWEYIKLRRPRNNDGGWGQLGCIYCRLFGCIYR